MMKGYVRNCNIFVMFMMIFLLVFLLSSCGTLSTSFYNQTLGKEPSGRQKISKQEDVVITKLPATINSNSSEINPTISADGKYLYFSRSKEDNLTDYKIYVSKLEADTWLEAVQLPKPPNIDNQNYIGSVTADRQTLVFIAQQTVTFKKTTSYIFIAKLNEGKWEITEKLTFFEGGTGWGFNILSGKFDIESGIVFSDPFLSADGNKLFFVCNRQGGYGITDIYMTEKTSDGKWGEPKNLGPNINTKEIEMSPFLHPDNKTLYFISNGHPGIGKLDVYRSVLENGQWGKPELLGYPISSNEVETHFSISADGQAAYFASDRESPASADIYTTPVPKQLQPQLGVVQVAGIVKDGLSKKPLEADLKIEELKSGKTLAVFQSDYATGEYVVTLPKGAEYTISANKKDYTFYSMNFNIPSIYKESRLQRDIELFSIQKGTKLVLNNVFFDTGSDKLIEESKYELDKAIAIISNYSEYSIEIGGHTDNVGSEKLNMELSKKRAESVMKYLINNGIPLARLSAKGYGFTVPVASNDTEEGRQKNRRVELIFK